jgi:very-short-patch-repair endonuclease
VRTDRIQLERARRLRREMTDAERRLWAMLRGSQLEGAKFRRQVPIGRYIADFACFKSKLIVELDGSQHADSAYDAERDAWLEAQGFRVLRFWNAAMEEPEGVAAGAIARSSSRCAGGTAGAVSWT